MKKNLNYLDKIEALLNKKGITQRKHASTIANILGIQYKSAKQKLDKKRGIKLSEIITIFKYFNEPFKIKRNHNCVYIVNDVHKICNINVCNKIVTHFEDGCMHAIKKDDIFIIYEDKTKMLEAGNQIYQIKNIEFLPAPKIAILDNDIDLLNLLKKITKRYGIEADTYQTKEELSKKMNKENYQAFIIDWLLDFNETSEDLIKKIDISEEESKKIIILTGQLENYEKNIGDIILNYDITLIEKPAKPLIISSILLSSLFF
ncbi:MAG TPA: helix-turn-helix domain-containing protein [Arsenophonus apicola]|uniref:helix-turn-helix domain-containing protein n=1 Tax=Arsenophonus apicola TaxID=2879119 RepID=UPI001CDD4DBF|nr:helix-turn-helix domain-containing protein [Arsenophonus apicola]UBX30761.1 response regulator [Arsenophonus apicola]